MRIVIGMNRADKRVWRQRARRCRDADERRAPHLQGADRVRHGLATLEVALDLRLGQRALVHDADGAGWAPGDGLDGHGQEASIPHMTYQTLLFEIKDGVAFITINRPDKLNALNNQVVDELAHAVAVAGRHDDARAARQDRQQERGHLEALRRRLLLDLEGLQAELLPRAAERHQPMGDHRQHPGGGVLVEVTRHITYASTNP